MEKNRLLTLVLAIALVAIVIIGLVDFDLFISIWVKVFVAVLLIGTVVVLLRSLFRLE